MKVSVVIPAYNEQGRVGKVVKAAVECDIVDEVVVVDDGSEDATAEEARRAGARVIVSPKNLGKGSALKIGISSTDADIYVLLDADLINFNCEHIHALVDPLLKDPKVGMTLGRFRSGRLATDLSQVIAPNISGQRALRRELARKIPDVRGYGYAIEIFLNDFARHNGYRIKYVDIIGASHVMKEEKIGLIAGFIYRLKMYYDIVKYLLFRSFRAVNFK